MHRRLTVSEAASLLGVSPDTVRRWARQGLLTLVRPSGEPTFEEEDLIEWARAHGLALHRPESAPTATGAESSGLAAAVRRGGIHRGLEADDRTGAMSGLVARLPERTGFDKAVLLEQLLAREKLSSTGLGHGVALPHPRKPSPSFAADATLVVGFLERPIDWQALDGEPVHTLFLLLNPDPARHLRTLSRLAFLLRDDAFCEFLARQPEDKALLQALAEREPAAS